MELLGLVASLCNLSKLQGFECSNHLNNNECRLHSLAFESLRLTSRMLNFSPAVTTANTEMPKQVKTSSPTFLLSVGNRKC